MKSQFRTEWCVMEIEIIVMGLLVGILVGMTGVGGAALLTPILMMLGINPTVAVGTDLFYNSITKLFGTVQHWRQKTINFKLVLFLAMGSIPGSIVAISLLQLFELFFQNQEQLIKTFIGYVLVFVSAATIFQTYFSNHFKSRSGEPDPIEGKKVKTILIGGVLGFIVGLTSIGSGSLFALALLYIYKIKTSELVGTDIAHAFVLVSVAGFVHAGLGHVDFLLATNLLIGSIPGVLLGSYLSTKISAKPLRTLMAVVILLAGIKLII